MAVFDCHKPFHSSVGTMQQQTSLKHIVATAMGLVSLAVALAHPLWFVTCRQDLRPPHGTPSSLLSTAIPAFSAPSLALPPPGLTLAV